MHGRPTRRLEQSPATGLVLIAEHADRLARDVRRAPEVYLEHAPRIAVGRALYLGDRRAARVVVHHVDAPELRKCCAEGSRNVIRGDNVEFDGQGAGLRGTWGRGPQARWVFSESRRPYPPFRGCSRLLRVLSPRKHRSLRALSICQTVSQEGRGSHVPNHTLWSLYDILMGV